MLRKIYSSRVRDEHCVYADRSVSSLRVIKADAKLILRSNCYNAVTSSESDSTVDRSASETQTTSEVTTSGSTTTEEAATSRATTTIEVDTTEAETVAEASQLNLNIAYLRN